MGEAEALQLPGALVSRVRGLCGGVRRQGPRFQLRHCYHDLGWYTAFDKKGSVKCLDDYFVAGLYRSCESLYCLNMAKCCSLKEARQPSKLCGKVGWQADFNNGAVPVKVPANSFITGFTRSEGHQLKNIEGASYCGFVRGY